MGWNRVQRTGDQLSNPKLKVRSLPAQLIPFDAGVIIRRGMNQVKVEGLQAVRVAERIFKIAREGALIGDLLIEFVSEDRPSVMSLIRFLMERNFLVSCGDSPSVPEKPIDIFYWHFDPAIESTKDRIAKTHLGIVGLNGLTKEIVCALSKSHFQDLDLIDHPHFYDPDPSLQWSQHGNKPVSFQIWDAEHRWKAIECLIVCSDVGGGTPLQELNRLCTSHKVPFFPVVFRDMIGFLGPLVIPGETACYDCLTAREDSQLVNSTLRRTAERFSPLGREVSGHHPAMYSVLGNIAAFELMRFFSRSLPGTPAGTLIEVNLLGMVIKTRRVLKLPRCTSCSSMMTTPSVAPYKDERLETARQRQ